MTSSSSGNKTVSPPDDLIQIVNPLVTPDWDEQVRQIPGCTFFHGTPWLRVLHDTYGFEPLCLVKRQDGRITGLISLVEVSSWLTGKRGVSLPFADFCPPLATDEATAQALFQRALELGRERRWKTLELRGKCSVFSVQCSEIGGQDSRSGAAAQRENSNIPSVQFYTHTLELRPGVEAVFQKLESSNRRAIRKAESSGLTVKITDSLEGMQVFHQLYCLTRQRHGLPPQPFKFFKAIHNHIISKGFGFIVQADFARQPVASYVFFTHDGQALYKYGASDHTAQSLRANNLVMWAAIKSLIDKGFEMLHFGRTSLDNHGLRRFKNSWNSAENLLSYNCYNFRQSQFVKENDHAQGWHARVFRFMPITLARMIGAALYRHTA